ncbi:homocysteine S-methyltransferase [Parahaliea maris]|uniref:Homocysteine S-methyltransferase n=1 Tax=Parahaliea maris TaxID=2716870 RepID=A0A5C8ZST0_9GAMM|nr:homocysteine S-methyltransferase family protein [Parahaliea maris]TXS90819.1 homocysteine S-methyltransferase [Parahaliea maris]
MKYRNALPQINGKDCLTDGGLETTLVFLEGIDLPQFSAIYMLVHPQHRQYLEDYYRSYIELGQHYGVGVVLESATWRSSHGWAEALGYSPEQLDALNRDAIRLLTGLREACETPQSPLVVSGCIGPRGDGYVAEHKMSVAEAEAYHRQQIELFADEGVDCVTAMTMNYIEEAAGIARAAAAAGVPAVISFTVETDGRLITGESLEQAISAVDAACDSPPAYYMINCAHPTHFDDALASKEPWVQRIRGLRANASKCSHAELDCAEKLDIGNPQELAREYRVLTGRLPQVSVVGGCCGTDMRHIRAIAEQRFGEAPVGNIA